MKSLRTPDTDFDEFMLALGGGKPPRKPPAGSSLEKPHYIDYPDLDFPGFRRTNPILEDVQVTGSKPPIIKDPESFYPKEEVGRSQSQLYSEDLDFEQEERQKMPIHHPPPKILEEENVEPFNDYPPPNHPLLVDELDNEAWLREVDPDLIADQFHKPKQPSLPPFVPIDQECMPQSDARKVFNYYTDTRTSSFVKLFWHDIKYQTHINYNESHPNKRIKYIHSQYSLIVPENFLDNLVEDGPRFFLSLNILPHLTIADGSNYIRWLAEKIYISYENTVPKPSVIFYSFQITAKLVYQQHGQIPSLTVTSVVFCVDYEKLEETLVDTFLTWITELINRSGEDEYNRWFHTGYHDYEITNLNILHFVHSDSGGCYDIQKPAREIMNWVSSPQTRCNYCFFAALLEYPYFRDIYLGIPNYNEKLEQIRTDAGLMINLQPVFLDQLPGICDTLNISVNLYTEVKSEYPNDPICKRIELLQKHKYQVQDPGVEVNLLFLKRNGLGHFYNIINLQELKNLRACAICYTWLSVGSDSYAKHLETCTRCNVCKLKKTANHTCRGGERKRKFKKEKDSNKKLSPWDKDVYGADFETYTLGSGSQKAYCVAIVSIDDVIRYKEEQITLDKVRCEEFWGDDCIKLFVDYIRKLKRSITILFYNGCRFDYWLLCQELIDRKIQFNMQKDAKTSQISILSVGKIRFLDPFRFTGCSLAEACVGFNVPKEYCKKDMDHSKVVDLQSANRYKSEIIEYCKYDVISMMILYIIMAENYKKLFDVSLKDYISLPHMAYQVWMDGLPKEWSRALTLPNSEEYTFLRNSLFGGRVYPLQPEYDSNLINIHTLHEDWKNFTEERKDQIIKVLENSPKQLKVYDFTSLYPWAAQKGIGRGAGDVAMFPCGNYEWVPELRFSYYFGLFRRLYEGDRLQDREMQLLHRCFFEVDIDCPNDIDIPVLLAHEKRAKGFKIRADLKPKNKQCYSGVILSYVIAKHKYQLKNIYRVLKYGRLLPLQVEFMSKVMKIKEDADKEGNQVIRTIAKNMANSETGKHSQRAIEEEFHLHYTDEFMKFLSLEELQSGSVKIETFFDNLQVQGFYVGTPIKGRDVYKKCPQIGVVILDYSKIIMDDIMYQCGLHRKNKLYYTDTDSMIVEYGVYLEHKNLPFWGSQYGHMKDEYPDIIWTHGVFLAPKTYSLLGIDKKTKKMVQIVKAKGAPQDKSLSKRGIYYIDDLMPYHHVPKYGVNNLKHIMFHLVEDGRVIEESNFLPFLWLKNVISDSKRFIVVRYGSFKKTLNFKNEEKTYSHIRLMVGLERTINYGDKFFNLRGNEDYSEITRVFVGDRTYPVGHLKDPNKNII